MYSHNGLYPTEELAACEAVMEIHRDKTCLPVMAVDNVGAEVKHGKCREHSLIKVHEFLNVPVVFGVGLVSREVMFVVNEIEGNSLMNYLKYTNILLSSRPVHIEVGDILHFVLPLLLHAGIFREDNSYIKKLLVKSLRQRAYNVSQSACFDKRYTFR